MEKIMYWDEDTFGSGPIPQNLDEICSVANSMLDAYMAENADASDEDVSNYSESLWNSYCMSDVIGSVTSIW